MIQQNIGEVFRQRRHQLNYTLVKLSGLTEMATGNLSNIERGKYLPRPKTARQIADALKLDRETFQPLETSK